VQLQVISSLLAVFIFQNVVLLVLASKIYLSKNYTTSLHALTKSRQMQIAISPILAIIHFGILFAVLPRDTCLPGWTDMAIINISLALSPLLQSTLVSVAS